MQRIAVLAALTALCHIGRLVFQFIPNVQPMTTILLLITLTMGTIDGLVVTLLSLVLSNMFLGMGPWTLSQFVAFVAVILLTGCLRPLYHSARLHPVIKKVIFVAIAFLSGFLYGFVISIIETRIYGISNFWVYYLQGISFDFLHAIGNAGFFLLLEPILVPLINQRNTRLSLKWRAIKNTCLGKRLNECFFCFQSKEI